ncbi:MAG: hypothetical protein Q8R20_02170, partial [Nanoarchaeota archaeon]|nr:hypothetical protein [Nanoarchaeota archaeon]
MRRFSWLMLACLLVFASVSSAQELRVTRAPDDAESVAGIAIAGTEVVLGKFGLTAIGSDLTADILHFAVGDLAQLSLSPNAVDEVRTLRLYVGGVLFAEVAPHTATGYAPFVTELILPENYVQHITVTGLFNTVPDGADSGASVFLYFFEAHALGKATQFTTQVGLIGNRKVVYKTKPIITLPRQLGIKLGAGENPVIRFTIGADPAGPLAWRGITFQVSPVGADVVAAVDTVAGTTGNVAIRKVETATNLNIALASSGQTPFVDGFPNQGIPSGQSGYISVVLSNAERIPAGANFTYEFSLTFRNVSPVAGAAYVSVRAFINETVSAGPGNNLQDLVVRRDNSFVWSDHSSVAHSDSSPDWANGWGVPGLPSESVVTDNGSGIFQLPPPPPPPTVREERFIFPKDRWVFFAPVGV